MACGSEISTKATELALEDLDSVSAGWALQITIDFITWRWEPDGGSKGGSKSNGSSGKW